MTNITPSPAIDIENLTKRYGDITAVDAISLQVGSGEVFGFLGPNGAGKTSTIRMLTGVLRPDAGSANIAGHDIRTEIEEAKSAIGIVPEQFNAYPDLSAWKNLMLAGELYGVPREARHDKGVELLRSFGLYDRRTTLAKEYSKGMKQRLMLTMALIHNPGILFLDEPITGLDVESQHLIRGKIGEFNQNGRTVFLTTHDIEEADQLCNRIAIIDRGEIAAIDAPEALKEAIERTRSVEVSFSSTIERAAVASLASVEDVRKRGDKFRLRTPNPDTAIKGLVNLAQRKGLTILALQTLGPSLEDAFISLTEGS